MIGVFLRGISLFAGLIVLASAGLFGLRSQAPEFIIASEIQWNNGELSPKEWFYDGTTGEGRMVDHLKGEAYREVYSPGGMWQFWVIPDMENADHYTLMFRHLSTGQIISKEVYAEPSERTLSLQVVWLPNDDGVLWRFYIEDPFSDPVSTIEQQEFEVISLSETIPAQMFPIENIRQCGGLGDR